jgi:hypothetical protein
MWKKGIKTRQEDIHFISFIDFAPTILELSGISQTRAECKKCRGEVLQISSGQAKTKCGQNTELCATGKERHDVGRPYDQGYPIRGIISNGFLFLEL